jgi:hypothetical protein
LVLVVQVGLLLRLLVLEQQVLTQYFLLLHLLAVEAVEHMVTTILLVVQVEALAVMEQIIMVQQEPLIKVTLVVTLICQQLMSFQQVEEEAVQVPLVVTETQPLILVEQVVMV